MTKLPASVQLFLVGFAGLAAASAAQTRLLRFPDLYGDRVVFTYGGDLWTAPASGGRATHLTAHPGQELFAKFSPDGRSVAFTGQIDGDEQVYVMPSEGGVPRQLTFYPADGPLPPRWGYDNQVYDFSPDGKSVLFRSMRDGWDLGDTQLFLVPVTGGMPQALPMPESGGGALSPDGRRVVYSPVTRDFRHWKRYQGGWAQDLFILDRDTLDTEQITDNPRSDRDPMWLGDKIYFTSDRTGTLNLYVYDTSTHGTEQLTHSTTWDVRWPSADATSGRIVFELGGQLVLFDPATGTQTPIEIEVPSELLARRPSAVAVADQVEDFGLSPEGKRAVFSARGDIFTVPIEHGPTRNLTRSSGAHDRQPTWSPDGTRIAYVSDADGEEEIWTVAQDGRSEPVQRTDGSQGQYFDLDWSPDNQHLAYRNQSGKVFVLDLESGAVTEVLDDLSAFNVHYSWSPDGKWLAVARTEPTGFSSIFLWVREDGSLYRVTDALWNAFSPSFAPDGKYLYFVEDREFHPQLGSFEFNYVVNRESSIYALALAADGANPFPPRSDEVASAESESKKEGDAEGGDANKKAGDKKDAGEAASEETSELPEVRVDLDGLSRRVVRVPVDPDNYAGLVALDGKLLILRTGAAYYGRPSNPRPAAVLFDVASREETVLAEDVAGLAISQDGSKLLVGGNGYRVLDADAQAAGKPGKTLDLSGMVMEVDPAKEWAQIFDEVWRRFRDDFYVSNMHGYDWPALREQYRPLLRFVAHRTDLNYLLGEMVAELNVSHSYVSGGDYELPERPHPALLGARFELDADSGRYRVSRVFEGQNEEPTFRSPLTEVGVGVGVGTYLLAINGVDLAAPDNPFRVLRHHGSAPVELLVNDTPTRDGARTVLVDPIASEDDLIYFDWVQSNRRRVTERSGGRLGYLHIPDMGANGIREWVKWYYGQVRREGLVVDVRSNGGGNVSPMLIERLMRRPLMVDFERNQDLPDTYPGAAFYGHLVCLIDEDTASDGDQFAYIFQHVGLGQVIGKRSWGGVVGIYGRTPLIDGGSVSVPESGSADMDGNWVVEGHGVDPDIEVENSPKQLIDGVDAQLEKAIDVLMEEIDDDPMRLPERPAPPVKTP